MLFRSDAAMEQRADFLERMRLQLDKINWILQSLFKMVKLEQDVIRFETEQASLKDTAYKAIYARDTLTRQNLKEPTIEEIAAEVGISKEDIVYAMDAIQNPMSLYEPIYTDGGDTLYVMDQISDKKNKEENWVEHLSLSEAMKRLAPREYEIISLRFFSGKTQMEVAEMIGISQAQVSRLEKNALKTMRAYLSA